MKYYLSYLEVILRVKLDHKAPIDGEEKLGKLAKAS